MATGFVLETAVFGIPDKLLGNKLAALITPRQKEISEIMVLAASAERLPKYKLPASIKFTRSIPKNISGKIDRDKCLELILQPFLKISPHV